MQKLSEASEVEIPQDYSRQKAIRHAKENGNPIPQSGARQMLYMMLMKIGATGELPQQSELRISFINDFWRVMYFENNFCPGDIPFPIIIDSFTTALVQGVVERKGNNQAAICKAFNEWITRYDVCERLYRKRDEMYPDKKPKQIQENTTQESIEDYTNEELLLNIKFIKKITGIKMADMMLEELNTEAKKRGLI